MEDFSDHHNAFEFSEDELSVADALLQLQVPPFCFPLTWGSQRRRSGGRRRRLVMSELMHYSPAILLYFSLSKSHKKKIKSFLKEQRKKVKKELLEEMKWLNMQKFLYEREFEILMNDYHKKRALNLTLNEKKLRLSSTNENQSQSPQQVQPPVIVSQEDHHLDNTPTVVTIPRPPSITAPHFESPSGPLVAHFSFPDLNIALDEPHCNNGAVSVEMQQNVVNNEASTAVANSNNGAVSVEMQQNMLNNQASAAVANSNNGAVSVEMQQNMLNNQASAAVANSNNGAVSVEMRQNMLNNEASAAVASGDNGAVSVEMQQNMVNNDASAAVASNENGAVLMEMQQQQQSMKSDEQLAAAQARQRRLQIQRQKKSASAAYKRLRFSLDNSNKFCSG